MLVIRFGPADLGNVRFAISPLLELHSSVRALRDPSANAIHLPWIHSAFGQVDRADLELLLALQPAGTYTPDFVNPPPHSPLAQFEDELDEMLSTPSEQIRAEILNAYRRLPLADVLTPLIDDPDAGLEQLAGVIRRYWDATLAPHWDRLRMVLEGDVLYRARQMADGGAKQLFSDLHPELAFDGEALRIEKPFEEDVALDGRGLLFVPSVFVWPKLAAITKQPWQPTLIYPARGVGMLWEPDGVAQPETLADLLGERRAAVLSSLDAPRSTTEVARRLDVSPASVSQHLAILRAAGLVQGNRVRRVVLYARTAMGERLVGQSS
jgi:Family of unknown function (DUF5937)/Helix-turn-helix domain